MIYDYNNPQVLYCSTGIFDTEAYNSDIANGVMGGLGVLKSLDGGENWYQINSGLDHLYIGFLEMHPYNSQILFAAASNNATSYPPNNKPGGIFRTINGGETWEKLIGDEGFGAVTISKSNPDIVYAIGNTHIFRSSSGGNDWERLENQNEICWGPPGIFPGSAISAVVDPNDPEKLWVNNYGGGNFVSIDGGKSWQNSSKGYTGADIRDVSINANKPNIIYSAGRSGPFVSYDGGNNWYGINYGGGISEGFTLKRNSGLVTKAPKTMKNNGFLNPR